MTATGPEQVAFMRDTGNPLSAGPQDVHRGRAPTRLAYRSLIDFVPATNRMST